ncbi:DUF1629 domain-containing protein [Mesorhizobium sp. M0187]|uniref:imm11 family protein n=1 Tax=unclassified Mesorhizobium TaxID=325217 RepID=UPI003336552A
MTIISLIAKLFANRNRPQNRPAQVPERVFRKEAKFKKHGKFFQIGPTYRGGSHCLQLENAQALVPPSRILLGPTEFGGYGFPEYPETPRLRPEATDYCRPPKDLEDFHCYWLVSERLKDVLQSVDPDGVVFNDCDVFYLSGKPIEPKHYLCDIVRKIDAVDLESSKFRLLIGENGGVHYDRAGGACFYFKEEIVGDAHIFKQKNMGIVICTAKLREACVEAGIKNPDVFQDMSVCGRGRLDFETRNVKESYVLE